MLKKTEPMFNVRKKNMRILQLEIKTDFEIESCMDIYNCIKGQCR